MHKNGLGTKNTAVCFAYEWILLLQGKWQILPVGETLSSTDKSDSCLKTAFFAKTALLSLPCFPTLSSAGDWISLRASPFP